MRTGLALALAGALLLPVPGARAATPMTAVIVRLDPPAVPRSSAARDVARRMERTSEVAQAPVLALLAALRREGHVRHVRSLWIANAVAVSADASALAALAARADVRSIERDSQLPIRLADTGTPGSRDRRHRGTRALEPRNRRHRGRRGSARQPASTSRIPSSPAATEAGATAGSTPTASTASPWICKATGRR